jgi:uncharacterized phage-associated protein
MDKSMHDARAIANFFIDRATERRMSLTVMTLLKVIYFAHAWHLAKFKKPLVAQPFEAWQYGPVNRVVYDQFKGYGRRPIDKKATSFDPILMSFTDTEYSLDGPSTEFLQNIFDYYGQFHPFRLSDLTHEEGGPWDTVWKEAERRAVPGMTIPNELIAAWFSQHGGVYGTERERRIVQ